MATTMPQTKIKSAVILFIIVLLAIALRLYCFRGFVGLDDAEYSRFANQMNQGTFALGSYEGPAVFPLRVGIIFPTAILYGLFGISELSMVAYPLALSILGILLAFFCGSYLFGRFAGLIAAAIWAVLPVEMQNATKLLPDLPGAFYGAVCVIFLLLVLKTRIHRKLILFSGGFLAGIAFGMSWLCKETIAYLVPFLVILFIVTSRQDFKRNLPIWIGAAAGALGVLFAEMAIYYHLTGDLFFRFHEMERNYLQWKDGFFTEGSRWGWPIGGSYVKALVKRIFLTGPAFFFLNPQFLFIPSFAAIACLHACYWQDKKFLIPSLWFVCILIMFNFSSSSLSSYMPVPLFERYFYLLFFPAVLVTAGFLGKLISSKRRGESSIVHKEQAFWGSILLAVLILIGGYQAFRAVRDIGNIKAWKVDTRRASHDLSPEQTVFTDAISKKGLEFYWRYPDELKVIDFEGIKSTADIPQGSYVLTNRQYVDWLVLNAGMWLTKNAVYKKPEFIDKPPRTWKRLWKNTNASLFEVESE